MPPRGSETDSIGQDVRRDIGYQAYQENHQPEAHERRQILSKPPQARPLSIDSTIVILMRLKPAYVALYAHADNIATLASDKLRLAVVWFRLGALRFGKRAP